MSFRIEEKLYIKAEHLIDFKKFLIIHLPSESDAMNMALCV